MPRTYVITGSASGIGAATKEMLEQQGHRVIGADIADAEITVDLATAEGRTGLVEAVTQTSGGVVDGVLAVAGLAQPRVATAAVNYFGAVATLQGLRPLLERSEAPRAVAVSSMAGLFPADEVLLEAFLGNEEEDALERAALLETDQVTAAAIYGTSKQALSRWVRLNAPSAEWAGASIALNAVAPGVVMTPMTADLTATDEARARLGERVPMPLNGFFGPESVAELLVWLAGEGNAHLCGQVIYIDGGSDAVIRGDSVF